MASKFDIFGRLNELEAAVAQLRLDRDTHDDRLDRLTGDLDGVIDRQAALGGRILSAERRLDETQSADVILRSELDRLTERVAKLEAPPPPLIDLTDYLDEMEALVIEHRPAWVALADKADDKVRYVIDGLTNLADACDLAKAAAGERVFAELAIDLCRRVGATYTGSTGSTWTADTRLAAGFRRAAEVADRLGVDGSPASDHADAVFRANEHRRDEILVWPVYQGQAGAMARLARGVDDGFADALVADILDEIGRRNTYGAGFEPDDKHDGGRPWWRSGREYEWLLWERPDIAEPTWNRFWQRCALDRDGLTFFASHVDGHIQAQISPDDIRPWPGAARLADGLCLLPEARPYVRAVLGMAGPTLGDLVVPGAVNHMLALNRSDPADGHYEAALIGGAALGETL